MQATAELYVWRRFERDPRRWLAQSAVLWPGPASVSSSKDDVMQMVVSRRGGPIAMLDLRPIAAPFYPNDFVS